MAKGVDDDCQDVRGSAVALLDAPAPSAAGDDVPADYNSQRLDWDYVDTPQALTECVQALRAPGVTVIGLDIETPGVTPNPWGPESSIRLIQVAVEHPEPKQWLIDTWHAGDMSELAAVFAEPSLIKVTCNGVFEQTHILYRYGTQIRNLWDVCYASRAKARAKHQVKRDQFEAKVKNVKAGFDAKIDQARALVAEREEELKAAKRKARKKSGRDPEELAACERAVEEAEQALSDAKEARNMLREERRDTVAAMEANKPRPRQISHNFRQLMRRYPGKQISKAEQTSDWGAERLTVSQQRYAALDAAGLLDIYRGLKAEIDEMGLTEQVDKENERVYDRAVERIEAKGSHRSDEVVRLLRAFAHSKSPEQLDRFYALRAQMTISHRHVEQIDAAYAARAREFAAAA